MIKTSLINTEYTTIIRPKEKWQLLNLKEIWHYRELFYIFTWRDLKVRYKQTMLGVLWVIFQPLVTMIIFTNFFGKIAKIPSENLPYELFVFVGLVFWNFFSGSITNASNSLIDNSHIIKKVYFPREIIPLSIIITSFVDFLINMVLLFLMTLFFGYFPSYTIFYILPICIFITAISAAGIGLFLASFNVKYRDVRYILPFFISILIFLTPVIYPSSAIRSSFRQLFALNPMTGVIESMRLSISGSSVVDLTILSISIVSALMLLLFGLIYFRSTERFFADNA